MKILVTVPMAHAGLDLLKGLAEAKVDIREGISREHLREIIGDYQVLIADVSTPIVHDVLDRAANLKLIGLIGMGRPSLDVESATRKGVLVMDAPGSVAVSAAEHVLSLILALVRHLPEADSSLKAGQWRKKPLLGREIRNKTLGLIGFGRVGTAVADRARCMGMHVLVDDPHLSSESVSRRGCQKVDRKELFSRSHVISVQAPLTPDTRGLVGPDSLSLVMPGTLIVNCSSGRIVDEDALYEAIVTGRVAGAALDLHEEPRLAEHPLYLSDRVICTPNLSVHTVEAMAESSLEIANDVVAYLQKGEISRAVNLPHAEDTLWSIMQPWLHLGEIMGRFVHLLHPDGLRGVEVELAGEESVPMEAFSRSVLKGVLGEILGESVNLINAKSLAGERGVGVTERRKTAAANYRSLATVRLDTDGGAGSVSGTLFDGRNPRIVEIDTFELEAVPDGDFLVVFNRDRPGVIADVAEALGRKQINIGQMYNGREAPGGRAITLFRIDSPVDDKTLQEISGYPNVLTAVQVSLTQKDLSNRV